MRLQYEEWRQAKTKATRCKMIYVESTLLIIQIDDIPTNYEPFSVQKMRNKATCSPFSSTGNKQHGTEMITIEKVDLNVAVIGRSKGIWRWKCQWSTFLRTEKGTEWNTICQNQVIAHTKRIRSRLRRKKEKCMKTWINQSHKAKEKCSKWFSTDDQIEKRQSNQ